MNSKTLPNWVFPLHRYLGLCIGLIFIIAGLTSSVLVFENEIDQWLIQRQFGQVIPQEQHQLLSTITETVKTVCNRSPSVSSGETP